MRVYAYADTERCRRHGPAPQRSPGATHTAIAFSITPRENRWACRRDTTGEGVHVRRRQAMPPSRLPPALHASNPHDRLHLSRPNPTGLRVPMDRVSDKAIERQFRAFTSTAVMWTNGYITHAVEQKCPLCSRCNLNHRPPTHLPVCLKLFFAIGAQTGRPEYLRRKFCLNSDKLKNVSQ